MAFTLQQPHPRWSPPPHLMVSARGAPQSVEITFGHHGERSKNKGPVRAVSHTT